MVELPLLLALGSAVAWGTGDFLGGLATRSAKAIGTTFVSQAVGLIGLVIVATLGAGGSFVGKDLAWGTGAGLSSMIGLALFYEAMGRGSFGAVASITSVVSGAIPIGVGLLLGERPSRTVLVGVCIAVFAIWLIAGERRKPNEESPRIAMVFALGAGIFFGGYFVLLSRAGGESGLWPLVAGRIAATVALGLTILILGYGNANAAWVPPKQSLKFCAVAGVFDATANALYFYASRNGLLSVVAVLASLYPASTIILARVALKERVNRRRLSGMMMGLASVATIAAGGVSIPEVSTVVPAEIVVPAQLGLTDSVSPPSEIDFGDSSISAESETGFDTPVTVEPVVVEPVIVEPEPAANFDDTTVSFNQIQPE